MATSYHQDTTMSSPDLEKPPTRSSSRGEHLEVVRTISKIPDNSHYYNKEGLRTEGDGLDHTRYDPKSLAFIGTVAGCAFGLTASQITPLLYLTLASTIANSLGRPDLLLWLLTAGLVAQGAIAPFVGPLADLFGRKIIFIIGFLLAIAGCLCCVATPSAAGFLAGQILLGFGAVTQELLSISVVAESVPTEKRTLYSALVLLCIIPWSPGTMYANWITISSWRYVGVVLAIWNLLSLILIAVFYRPPPRTNALGLTLREKIARIDAVGGTLLTTGLVFVLVALNWGGVDYPWKSAHVLSFLLVGFALMIICGLYEKFLAPHPMFPRRIIYAPRPFFCMLFVIFAAGINYIPLVVFYPIQMISVYQSNHFWLGVNTLPIGTCILAGAILSSILLYATGGRTTLIMCTFCVLQTVGAACLSAADPFSKAGIIAAIVFALVGEICADSHLLGGVLVPNQVILTVITPDDLIGSVTALSVGLRAQSQVVGLAIYYNQFLTQLTKNTIKWAIPAFVEVEYGNVELITAAMTTMTSIPFREWAMTVPPFPHANSSAILQHGITLAYSHSFQFLYYITLAFGIPAVVVAACMGNVKQYMDKHVSVPL